MGNVNPQNGLEMLWKWKCSESLAKWHVMKCNENGDVLELYK